MSPRHQGQNEYFESLKRQILTNAVALYGRDHERADHYDVMTSRGYDHRGPFFRAAVIVYLSKNSNSTWKLLLKSNARDSLNQAMEQILDWLQDDVHDLLCDMDERDIRAPVRRNRQRQLTAA